MKLFNWIARTLGRKLATYLLQSLKHYEQFSVIQEPDLKVTLRSGDILLVEGDARISVTIKYLTQSTWSPVCVFVGPVLQDEKKVLIEADLLEGVIAVPLTPIFTVTNRP